MRTSPRAKLMTKIAVWVVFLSAVFCVTGFIIVRMVSRENTVSVIGFDFYLTSKTKSMEPTLKQNDVVFVVNTKFSDVRVGDIVTFGSDITDNGKPVRALITHRVVEVVTDENGTAIALKTKGDNPDVGTDRLTVTKDGANGTNRYVGKVVHSSSFLGNLTSFIGSLAGIISVCVIAFCAVAIYLIIDDHKKKHGTKK